MNSFFDLSNMNGKLSVITGSTGHLGQVFAETLSELNSDLILIDLDSSKLAEQKKNLEARFSTLSIMTYVVDLEDEKQRKELVNNLRNEFQVINVLINNAAIVSSDELTDWTSPWPFQSLESWRRGLEVNLSAPFDLVRGITPQLVKSGNASVINLGSLYGLWGPDWSIYSNTPMGNSAGYAASKGALIQMSRWWATTMAPTVRSNAIVPGGIFRNQPEEFVKRYEAKTPLKRMASENDFKGVIAFLASDLSKYVTGQIISVDGGWSAW